MEECQHCNSRHPYARTFKEHYNQLPSGCAVRVLGLSSCLVKQKLKAAEEKLQAIKRMEIMMQSEVRDLPPGSPAVITSGGSVSTALREELQHVPLVTDTKLEEKKRDAHSTV